MTYRFPLKEIARQSGLGIATVDRVLNDRAHVSPQARARVHAAIAELEGQEAQLAARGRRMFFDFVIEAPSRFSREVQQATEQVIPHIGTAACRPRFHMQESMTDAEVVHLLGRILRRGSHGVCLKVRDTGQARHAVDRLMGAGIPVVTLVTDLSDTGRIAYVGLDNEGAGRTAAYLIAKSLDTTPGAVLATRSDQAFLGEEAREIAFVRRLSSLRPDLRVISLSGGGGRHLETARLLEPVVRDLANLRAVYSMGGGNRSILQVLDDAGQKPAVYVAHDLDRDNRLLISDGRIDFVLQHDLRTDMRNVFHALLDFHKLRVERPDTTISPVQVITPENVLPIGRMGTA